MRVGKTKAGVGVDSVPGLNDESESHFPGRLMGEGSGEGCGEGCGETISKNS